MDEAYKFHGVMGERLWEKRGGAEFARGITAIDVVTRYYRLRDDPLKTNFVIPAYQAHPGTKVTRDSAHTFIAHHTNQERHWQAMKIRRKYYLLY